jgi:hypothetical protein
MWLRIIAGMVTEMAVKISSFLPVHHETSRRCNTRTFHFVRGQEEEAIWVCGPVDHLMNRTDRTIWMSDCPFGERSSAHMHASVHRQVICLI